MNGESPYLPILSIYNLIFSIVKIAGYVKKLSLVNNATAWPTKSTVLGSNSNFLTTAANGILVKSKPSYVLGLDYS